MPLWRWRLLLPACLLQEEEAGGFGAKPYQDLPASPGIDWGISMEPPSLVTDKYILMLFLLKTAAQLQSDFKGTKIRPPVSAVSSELWVLPPSHGVLTLWGLWSLLSLLPHYQNVPLKFRSLENDLLLSLHGNCPGNKLPSISIKPKKAIREITVSCTDAHALSMAGRVPWHVVPPPHAALAPSWGRQKCACQGASRDGVTFSGTQAKMALLEPYPNMGKGSQIILAGCLYFGMFYLRCPESLLSSTWVSAVLFIFFYHAFQPKEPSKRYIQGMIHFTCFTHQHRMSCTPELSASLPCLQKSKQLTLL